MPDATQSNGDSLSESMVQDGPASASTGGRSAEELKRLEQIQQERMRDPEQLVREFIEQVSFDPYYKATLKSWPDDTDAGHDFQI
jgi:hypothetical protein